MIKYITPVLYAGCLAICICMTKPTFASISLEASDGTYGLEVQLPAYPARQYAKSTFLPDRFDDLGLSDYSTIDGNYNPDDCSDYTLTSCPSNASCTSCPSNKSLYKFLSCQSGYKLSGSSCVAANCATLGYVDYVPLGQICTPISSNSLNCYKDCRNVACSGYTLDCNSLPTNATSVTKCPECTSDNANCGDNVCKIDECEPGYKVSDNGTFCEAMDDTCPEGYYKDCETGTQGEPVLTEAGNKCYQCKAQVEECPVGQLNSDTYWCTPPQTINCQELGYKRTSGTCGNLTQIACPFDQTTVACIDFE